MSRVPAFLIGAALAACAAVPLAAQQLPEATNFLKAVRSGDADTVTAIANNPSSTAVNARDHSSGEGALHILVQRREINWLAYLLARGARPDLQRNDGTTPLGLAAQLGWVEGAEQLLARGAKVDLPNVRGETPLILAVQARQVPSAQRLAMIGLLLRLGADPNRQDRNAGYSALDYARQDRRSPEILRALETRPQRRAAAVGPNP
jgi:ankyrin repeat protein